MFILALVLLPFATYAQTLEECQQAAEQNYPLIRQYDLIKKTTDLTVSNIAKGWLPQVSASAQVTYQSDVAVFPDQMQNLYQQIGLDMNFKEFIQLYQSGKIQGIISGQNSKVK